MTNHPTRLAPVPVDVQRPLWSVMIPSYNCAGYLKETLQSVLVQDPGEAQMQIEVIDDASTDEVAAVVEEYGRGRVMLCRQPVNVGHVANFATALQRSRGYLVHLLHGDDRVMGGFYCEMEKLFREHPELGAGFCRHYFIDEQGEQGYISPVLQRFSGPLPDGRSLLFSKNPVQTPSMVVKRTVYETVGIFDKQFVCTEDWEMWARIANHFPIGWVQQPLAEYRLHTNSNSGRNDISGAALKDHERVLAHLEKLAPDLDLTDAHEQVLYHYFLNTSLAFKRKKKNRLAYQMLWRGLNGNISLRHKLQLLKQVTLGA